jgi:hypothetical protein
MENTYNKHYIITDANGNITDGWSDGPLPDKPTDGAILYNEQGGYQFRIIIGGVPMPENELFDGWGNPLYRWDAVTGEIVANPPGEPPEYVVQEAVITETDHTKAIVYAVLAELNVITLDKVPELLRNNVMMELNASKMQDRVKL